MKLRITIDKKAYEVEVDVLADDPRVGSVPTRSRSVSGSSAGSAKVETAIDEVSVEDEAKVVRSPVTGVVIKVNAQAGQEIQTDDQLFVLEAMKMESSITSPITGTIKTVTVAAGDGVKTGQPLIVFE